MIFSYDKAVPVFDFTFNLNDINIPNASLITKNERINTSSSVSIFEMDLHAEATIEKKNNFEEFVELVKAVNGKRRKTVLKAILSLDSEINLDIYNVKIQGKISGPLQFDNCKFKTLLFKRTTPF